MDSLCAALGFCQVFSLGVDVSQAFLALAAFYFMADNTEKYLLFLFSVC